MSEMKKFIERMTSIPMAVDELDRHDTSRDAKHDFIKRTEELKGET